MADVNFEVIAATKGKTMPQPIKIMKIAKVRVEERLEFMHQVKVFSEVDMLVIASGKRTLKLNIDELEHYFGERARRGLKLPRGFQKVDSVTVLRGDS